MEAGELQVEFILETFASCGLEIDEQQALMFQQYALLLTQNNPRFNLTRLTEPREILEGHFLDSILGAGKLGGPPSGTLLDIGPGGGFPGIPLKIYYAGLKITMLEASRKKILFLRLLQREMGLENVEVLPFRAEEYGSKKGREQYSWVAARAVASLPVLLELALPLVQVGGVFWAYKGPQYKKELEEAGLILQKCGGVLQKVVPYELPAVEKRAILCFEKRAPAEAQFPRRPGIPQKKPLV